MDLQKLLSVNMATLAALGTLLLAMGQDKPWAALVLWMSVVVSLVVTDFTGWLRLSRNVGCLLGIVVLVICTPHCFRLEGEGRLLALADLLTYLQVVFLFQEKDERVYWWLAVMSLLQVIVAAGFSQGVGFGLLLVLYMLVGMTGLALLILYSEWQRHGKSGEQGAGSRERGAKSRGQRARGASSPLSAAPTNRRWPLANVETTFTGTPAGSSLAWLVRELYVRLGLLAFGTLTLALVIFFTVPRLGQPAFRGMGRSLRQVVGYNDKISLGEMGELEGNPEEVMRLKLTELNHGAPGRPCPVLEEVYLRGTVVTDYEQNQWSRKTNSSSAWPFEPGELLGRPRRQHVVLQTISVEPLDHANLFYVWPLVPPLESVDVTYNPQTEQLRRTFHHARRIEFNLKTSALVDGQQAALVPSDRLVDVRPLLQSPPLPRLKALADRWVKESGLSRHRHYEIARLLEQKLSSSGQFQYSLQGQDRDLSIDAVEDFVSNNPRGHCEYFATALALMLRSQGIPSRVVLGYRCDEWDDVGEYYQVRQLHAHAWVEAYLGPEQAAGSGEQGARSREQGAGKGDAALLAIGSRLPAPRPLLPYGGWLRLDGTPAGDIGSAAAGRSAWGQWQRRMSRLQSAWDDYFMDMDRARQQKTLYRPLVAAVQAAIRNLRDPSWWRGLWESCKGALLAIARHGAVGWLVGIGVTLLAVLVLVPALWKTGRVVRRIWRRLLGRGSAARSRARSPVEFYHRFETLLARHGLVRGVGQTPREFARAAGRRLAQQSGRGELASLSVELVEAFYRVRFGGQGLDNAGVQTVEHALAEIIGAIANRAR